MGGVAGEVAGVTGGAAADVAAARIWDAAELGVVREVSKILVAIVGERPADNKHQTPRADVVCRPG